MSTRDPPEMIPPEPEKVQKAFEDDIEAATEENAWSQWKGWMDHSRESMHLLPRKVKLLTDEQARNYSLYSVYFVITCSAINTKMLNPNFAIMSTPGAHPDSFPNTDPFDFNSATYFLPMCTLLGVAISSVFIGSMSDRLGRKKVLVALSWISAVGSIVKYFTRKTFWGFCASNFAFGFFLGNLPVGMAYVGDIYHADKKKKEDTLGVLVGAFVAGNSGGGIIAILMNGAGLFGALWIGAAMMFVSLYFTYKYMIEPSDALFQKRKENTEGWSLVFEDEIKRPETINKPVLLNVVVGALLDNIGSTGLFPLCLSPLMIEQFLFDLEEKGEEPIMTITGYQWLSVMVAFLVIPSTMITPYFFKHFGVAATCVFGNVFTACVTVALLVIGNLDPATKGTFIGFVAVMYGGFPFTVFSQLTTGPMLDVLAPEDKIGYVQGLNNSSMNFGMAFAPWLLGLLADATSTNVAIITGIVISMMAAAANTPLMFRPMMGKPLVKPPVTRRPLPFEDEELVEKILSGEEYVHPQDYFELNRTRLQNHKPALIKAVRPYSDEKDQLREMASHAHDYFRFRAEIEDRVLTALTAKDPEKSPQQICDFLNAMYATDEISSEENKSNLGAWVADYLKDNGYRPDVQHQVLKLMVMSAFPPVTKEDKLTPENIEQTILNIRAVDSRYLRSMEGRSSQLSVEKILGTGSAPTYFS